MADFLEQRFPKSWTITKPEGKGTYSVVMIKDDCTFRFDAKVSTSGGTTEATEWITYLSGVWNKDPSKYQYESTEEKEIDLPDSGDGKGYVWRFYRKLPSEGRTQSTVLYFKSGQYSVDYLVRRSDSGSSAAYDELIRTL